MLETKRSSLAHSLVIPFLFAFALLLIAAPTSFASSSLVGPKKHYLALGDSLAFGYQPDLVFNHGYADDLYADLKSHGVQSLANMGCPGETSSTFINGGCPVPYLRKYPYVGAQLNAALLYLSLLKGSVSPVTLDIGANDVLPDINTSNCSINVSKFNADLATVDANLRQTILPKLHAALTENGQSVGDLAVMNYYDSYQNICPNTVPYVQLLNQHLASDVAGYGTVVDVFTAFGGATTPNPNICADTWECSIFKNIHATTPGYSVIANAFEQALGY